MKRTQTIALATPRALATLATLTALTAALAGCSVETRAAEEHTSSQAQDLYYFPPSLLWDLYGRALNGRALSGVDLTGHGVLGLSFAGAKANGRTLHSVWLDGSKLRATGGAHDLQGVTFAAQLDDGSTLPVRIDSVSDDDNADDAALAITRYTASYETDGGWHPYCGVDAAGAPVAALALAGRWDYRAGTATGGAHIDDPSSFTFACEGHALATCVDLGYAPWMSVMVCAPHGKGASWRGCHAVSLADTHQACTRAIRADYCGDGTSYTKDGMQIDLYDPMGVRIASPGWPFEAEWNASGALCAVRQRVPANGVPTCWARLQKSNCGASSDFDNGALLMSQEGP